MNKTLSLIGLIFLLSAIGFSQTKSIAKAEEEIRTFASPQNFEISYNASKYVTEVKTTFSLLSPKAKKKKRVFKKFDLILSSLFAVDGIDKKPVKSTLCFATQSKRFRFSSNRSLTVLLDGESILLGEGDRSTKIKGRKLFEKLCWEIDKDLIKDFGNASKVEISVGSIKKIFNESHRRNLSDYSNLLKIEE